MHNLGVRMEGESKESEMGCTGINWALAVCLVFISTVQEHISHLQSSLHSMPVWEGNCTSPFSKQGSETKGVVHYFSIPPWSQAGGLQVSGIEILSPKLPSLSAILPLLAVTNCSAIKLALQKPQLGWWHLNIPLFTKDFFFVLGGSYF